MNGNGILIPFSLDVLWVSTVLTAQHCLFTAFDIKAHVTRTVTISRWVSSWWNRELRLQGCSLDCWGSDSGCNRFCMASLVKVVSFMHLVCLPRSYCIDGVGWDALRKNAWRRTMVKLIHHRPLLICSGLVTRVLSQLSNIWASGTNV